MVSPAEARAPDSPAFRFDESAAADAPLSTSWKGVRRFYSHVDVAAASADASAAPAWHVLVQGRALRTHGMRELAVPTRALAVSIAGEFASQREFVLPATTPIYNLASSAIDQFVFEDLAAAENLEAEMRAMRLSTFERLASAGGAGAGGAGAGRPSGAEILAEARAADALAPQHAQALATGRSDSGGMGGQSSGTSKLRDLALDYLETDSVCYRIDWDMADPSERLLRKRQDKHYDPLIAWFAARHGAQLAVAVGLEDARHPEAAFEAAEDAVDVANPWLKAFYSQTLGCLKSTVLALALAHREVDVEAAFVAARVEEEYQIQNHGFVEDGHDSSRAYLRLQLASASAFLGMLPRASRPAALPSPTRRDYSAALAAHVAERHARVAARRARADDLVRRKLAAMLAPGFSDARE